MPRYNFDHKKRGQAVIIVNQEFWGQNAPSYREGADVDYEKMTAMFRNLDFYVSKKNRMNLTKDEMFKTIRKACKNKTRNKQSDCFVLVISTHGTEVKVSSRKGLPLQATEFCHAVYASDSKLVFVDEILDMFKDTSNADNGLNGKPKLFFLQACRSIEEKNLPFDPSSKYFGFDPGHMVLKTGSTPGNLTTGSTPGNLTTGITPGNLKTGSTPGNLKPGSTPGNSGDGSDNIDSGEKGDMEETKNKDQTSESQEEEFTEINMIGFNDIYAEEADWQSDEEGSEEISDANPDSTDKAEAGFDEIDANIGAPSGSMPPVPFDVVTLNCPKDCLIFYPVQPHKFAFRSKTMGSYLLHYMSAKENVTILLDKGLMAFLTKVIERVSEYEYWPDTVKYPALAPDAPYKMAATLVHRITGDVFFKEKNNQSRMAGFITWLEK